jgi:hypothetical protein
MVLDTLLRLITFNNAVIDTSEQAIYIAITSVVIPRLCFAVVRAKALPSTYAFFLYYHTLRALMVLDHFSRNGTFTNAFSTAV